MSNNELAELPGLPEDLEGLGEGMHMPELDSFDIEEIVPNLDPPNITVFDPMDLGNGPTDLTPLQGSPIDSVFDPGVANQFPGEGPGSYSFQPAPLSGGGNPAAHAVAVNYLWIECTKGVLDRVVIYNGLEAVYRSEDDGAMAVETNARVPRNIPYGGPWTRVYVKKEPSMAHTIDFDIYTDKVGVSKQ